MNRRQRLLHGAHDSLRPEGIAAAAPAPTRAPRERPILFRDEMVRAILAGEKTQTRRPVKNRAGVCEACFARAVPHNGGDGGIGMFGSDAYLRVPACEHNGRSGERALCRHGAPGDRLWVRETWRTLERPSDCADGILYRADDHFQPIDNTPEAAEAWCAANANGKHGDAWRPSIHLPRWASRILLEVTTVRVDRVQAITEADARAEGMATLPDRPGATLRDRFAAGWESMYAGGDFAWAKNPWVWVVEFRRVAP